MKPTIPIHSTKKERNEITWTGGKNKAIKNWIWCRCEWKRIRYRHYLLFECERESNVDEKTARPIHFVKKKWNGDAWMCLYIFQHVLVLHLVGNIFEWFHILYIECVRHSMHVSTLWSLWFSSFGLVKFGQWIHREYNTQIHLCVLMVGVATIAIGSVLVSYTIQASNLKFSCHVTKSMRDSLQ